MCLFGTSQLSLAQREGRAFEFPSPGQISIRTAERAGMFLFDRHSMHFLSTWTRDQGVKRHCEHDQLLWVGMSGSFFFQTLYADRHKNNTSGSKHNGCAVQYSMRATKFGSPDHHGHHQQVCWSTEGTQLGSAPGLDTSKKHRVWSQLGEVTVNRTRHLRYL